MDSARFAIAIVLMIALIIVTNLIFPSAQRTPAVVAPDSAQVTAPVTPDSPAAIRGDTAARQPQVVSPAPAPAVSAAPPQTPALVAADTVVVSSPLYRYGFSTLGGGIVLGELKQFESFTDSGVVNLVRAYSSPLLRYDLRVESNQVDLSLVPFTAQPAGGFALGEGDAPRALRMTGVDPTSGATIEIEYTFTPGDYRVAVTGRIAGLGEQNRVLMLRMGPALAIHEANASEDERALAYVINSRRDGISSVRLDKVDENRVEEGPLSWVAIKNKYFLIAAVQTTEEGAAGFGGLIAEPADSPNAALLTATVPVGREEAFSFALYLGPQEHERLKAMGAQLEDVNPYGWRVFRPIIRPLGHFITWCVIQLHNALGLSYGYVLILFGILVRIVLWPLNSKAMRAQMKNMEVQPKLKEVQDRHRNDPERLQKEMLRLYKEEGFNPFGGCLPMLLPFPVLITLFFVFQGTILFRGVEFLWLPDLSRHDPLYILPIVLGASMFVMQWLSLRSTPQPNPQMKMMMWFLPAFMVVIFLRLASGLNLYYAASTLASIPQQLQIMNERKKAQTRIASKPK